MPFSAKSSILSAAMRTLGTNTAFRGEHMTKTSLRAAEAASTLDIREQFPTLERHHNGHAIAYFDGPGGTQMPRSVAAAVTDYLYHHNANTHWNYPTNAETDAIIA